MDTIFLDFETYFSSEYSLRKMDPPSYILDPQFEPICLGVGINDDPVFVVDGPDIPALLSKVTTEVICVSHNALFDSCILSWKYNWVPKLICDTLAMSRTLLGHKLRSHALAKVAEHLGLPAKGDTLMKVQGWARADIIANGMMPQMMQYCGNDTDLCRSIYKALAPQLPTDEILLHDLMLRCAVEPALKLDMDILSVHLDQERERKELLFAKAMLMSIDSKADLMSNDRFAKKLKELGVNPPRKISKSTNLMTWAFSKTDPAFMELQEHPDERVQTLVAARLGIKTTIEETRTERMLNIGTLDFPYHGGTKVMPIPLKIGAAHTHRMGGDWKLNCQNWGRGSPIRKAVVAPKGYQIIAADSSQIEARINAWYCGQTDLVEQFRLKQDVYSNFARLIFNVEVSKEKTPGLRFVGKTGILQLGYQSGWPKFQATVGLLSRKEGTPVDLSNDEAQLVVDNYRRLYRKISGKWPWLQNMLDVMAGSNHEGYQDGPITFKHGAIVGPTGLEMRYDNMHAETDDAGRPQYVFDYGGYEHKIYGGKLLENIVQFLARIAVMQVAVRMRKSVKELNGRLVHTAHDELVYLAPDETAADVMALLDTEMRRSPDWAIDLPLSCDVKAGLSYGSVK